MTPQPTRHPTTHYHGNETQCNKKTKIIFLAELRIQLDSLQRDHELLQLENERYKDKVDELEKWIVLLTNNFYAGHPNSVDAITQGLVVNDEQR